MGIFPHEFYLENRVETNSNNLLFKKREVLRRDRLVAYWRNSHAEKLCVCVCVCVCADLASRIRRTAR